MVKKTLCLSVLFLSILALSGCSMSLKPNWQNARPDRQTLKSEAIEQKAHLLFEKAQDKDSLLASITAFEMALAENPGDYSTLTSLSTQYTLLGTAYTEKQKEKSRHFHQALRYAEQALYSNPAFKEKVAGGTPLWEAIEELDQGQVEAMFFWVKALQYQFKEGMNLGAKVFNVRWMKRGLKFLDRIEQVAPEFGGGGVEFAKGICYYVIPGIMGGSKKLGDEYMARSIARSDGWLFPRWARGKYYYVVTGEDEKSRADLEWVATRNLKNFKDSAPWKIHFQANAKELLN